MVHHNYEIDVAVENCLKLTNYVNDVNENYHNSLFGCQLFAHRIFDYHSIDANLYF